MKMFINKHKLFLFRWVCCLLFMPLSGQAEEIRIAVRAHAGEQHAIKKWQATIDYLNQALPAHHFTMIPYTSLKQQLADARASRFQFLLTNPATYVELEADVGAKAILTLINNRHGTAQTRFGSVIFTHVENTDILEIKDLRGKDFLAVNPLGFGGWRVGLKVLKEQGIEPHSDFASLQFAGKQPKVVAAVRDKKVHAGMVRTDMLERMADQGKVDLRNLRILNQQTTPDFPFFHSSALYPEWPFARMPAASAKLTEQIKQALLKIDRTHPAAITGKYMGWTPALDYTPVKILLMELGISPFAAKSPARKIFYWLIALSALFIVLYAFYQQRNKKTG